MHRLTTAHEDVPQSYVVNIIETQDTTARVKVLLNGNIVERFIPTSLLEPMEPIKLPLGTGRISYANPPIANTPKSKPTNEPQWAEPNTPGTIKVACACGRVSRHISAQYVKAWANENAAINYVKAACPTCNPYIGANNANA